MIKYIFFDLDETLIDVKKAQNLACEYLYNEYKFNIVVELKEFLKTWDDLTEYHYAFYTRKEISYEEQRIRRIRDLFNKYNIKLDCSETDIYNKYLKAFEDNWCLFDDAQLTIKKLYDLGYKLGVISNGDLKQQTQKLEKTGLLKYMIDVTTSSEYSFSKPDVRIYQEACKKNNIKYDELCYVGDDLKKDIIPCLELGIKAIWINRKRLKIDNTNIEQIHELNKLMEIFNK